jgi:hypothetical protein
VFARRHLGAAAKSPIGLAAASDPTLASSVLIDRDTEAIVARARIRPMIKPSRSNTTQPAKADAPVILGADDLAAIDGGNHLAGRPVFLVQSVCAPPPPPPVC